MARKSKRFTFVLIRETEHPIRQLRLSAWQLRAVVGILSIFVLSLVGLAVHGYLRGEQGLELSRAQEENARLREDVRKVHDRVAELEADLNEIDEFQRWTRTVANLEPLGEEALSGGVGGPVNEKPVAELAGVSLRLDRLAGRSHVLRQSAEGVLESLRDSEEKLSRIPSIRPIVGGRLSSRYGRRVDPFTGQPAFHRGIDVSARRGTPIMTPADGRVKKVRRSSAGYGNMLTIDHGNGFETKFAHCDRILVSRGQKVARGEVVATVGSTGHSTAPHLHYEVIRDGKHYNPSHYILSDEFIVD